MADRTKKKEKPIRARRTPKVTRADSPTASEVVAARKAEEQAQRERTKRIRERLREFWDK